MWTEKVHKTRCYWDCSTLWVLCKTYVGCRRMAATFNIVLWLFAKLNKRKASWCTISKPSHKTVWKESKILLLTASKTAEKYIQIYWQGFEWFVWKVIILPQHTIFDPPVSEIFIWCFFLDIFLILTRFHKNFYKGWTWKVVKSNRY